MGHGVEHAEPKLADGTAGLVRRGEEAEDIRPGLVSVAFRRVDLDGLGEDEMHSGPDLFRSPTLIQE